jgi:hypothetical protein
MQENKILFLRWIIMEGKRYRWYYDQKKRNYIAMRVGEILGIDTVFATDYTSTCSNICVHPFPQV